MSINIKDIEQYINDSTLDSLYNEKEESIYKISYKDKKEIKEIEKKYSINYDRLLLSIKNVPPHFNNVRETIIQNLESYVNRKDLISTYENEKFYKTGFIDGVKLILEISEKRK